VRNVVYGRGRVARRRDVLPVGEVSSAPRVNVCEMLYLVWDSVHRIIC